MAISPQLIKISLVTVMALLFIADLPSVWLFIAAAAIGDAAIRLIATIAGQKKLRLHFANFIPAFIPLFTAGIITTVLAAGFAAQLRREIIVLLAIAINLTIRYCCGNYKLTVVWPRIEFKWLWWWLPPALLLFGGVAVLMFYAPAQWDVMTYHLYIPARWLQQQQIIHVPTFFGDEAAAFAPGNAIAVYAWALALFNGDMLINLLAMPFFIMLALLVFLLVRRFNREALPAYIFAAVVIAAPCLFFKALSGYTDILAQGLLTAGVWWLLEYARARRNTRAALIYSALCLGLALGTKTVMLPLTAPVIAALAGLCIYRRQWKNLLIAAGIVIIAGGWWYCRNWYLYGNPLFPAHIKIFGVTLFAGMYDLSSFAAGSSGSWRGIISGFTADYGIIPALLLPLGWLGWILRIWQSSVERKAAVFMLSLSLLWTLIFCLVIPYNDQYRFLIGAWIIALPGAAMLFNAIQPVRLKIITAAALLLMLLLSSGGGLVKLTEDIPLPALLPVAAALAAAAVMLWLAILKKSPAWRLSGIIILMSGLIWAEIESGKLRIVTMGKSNIGAYQPLFAPFNSPQAAPQVIAYSGVNIPGIFLGGNFQNQVIYCNLSGANTDNSYDYWVRNGKMRFSFNATKFYQLNPSLPEWLKNIYDSKAEILVTMRLHPLEYNYHYHTEDGLPVESAWAEKLPNVFVQLISSQTGKVYRIDRNELLQAITKINAQKPVTPLRREK